MIDLNNLLANALLDRFDTEFPAGSILELRTGGVAGAENTDTGTMLVSETLPASPWSAAATGTKTKNGTWQVAASAAGVIGHYRLRNAGDTRRIEGTVTLTGAGGDMTVDNTNVQPGQTVTINSMSWSL